MSIRLYKVSTAQSLLVVAVYVMPTLDWGRGIGVFWLMSMVCVGVGVVVAVGLLVTCGIDVFVVVGVGVNVEVGGGVLDGCNVGVVVGNGDGSGVTSCACTLRLRRINNNIIGIALSNTARIVLIICVPFNT